MVKFKLQLMKDDRFVDLAVVEIAKKLINKLKKLPMYCCVCGDTKPPNSAETKGIQEIIMQLQLWLGVIAEK